MQIRLATPSLRKSRLLVKYNGSTSMNRRLEFQKRRSVFIRAHDEPVSVAAMRLGNDSPLLASNAPAKLTS
jgi:hypothetical protein